MLIIWVGEIVVYFEYCKFGFYGGEVFCVLKIFIIL